MNGDKEHGQEEEKVEEAEEVKPRPSIAIADIKF